MSIIPVVFRLLVSVLGRAGEVVGDRRRVAGVVVGRAAPGDFPGEADDLNVDLMGEGRLPTVGTGFLDRDATRAAALGKDME